MEIGDIFPLPPKWRKRLSGTWRPGGERYLRIIFFWLEVFADDFKESNPPAFYGAERVLEISLKKPHPTFSAVKLGWFFVWFPPPYGFYSILVQQNWRSNTMKPGRPSPRLGSPETFEAKLEQAQNDLGIPSVEQIPIQSLGTSWTVFFLNFGWVEEFRWWERWRYRHDFGPCQPESCFQKGVSQTTKLETFQVNFQGIFFPLLFGTVDCRFV